MNSQKIRLAALLLAAGVSGAAQAALQGRDLNGSAGSFEAYYDTVLDITWLADANYAQTSGYDADGLMTWAAANTWVANLSFYNPLTNQIYDSWRLPIVNPVNGSNFNHSYSPNGSTDFGYNVSEQGTAFAGSTGSEMAHLSYNTLNNKGACDPVSSTGSSCVGQVGWGLTNTSPFANFQTWRYWSGSEVMPGSNAVWSFSFSEGFQANNYGKDNLFYALAVSPGDIAAVPEPEAWGLMLSGLALLGFAARRRPQAIKRAT